ncbi:MAG: hypothetical protein CMQ46_09420 [Gammaproteobacteria bacterium]|nr:hypothetical protein [Gammaproteobacteria bacterium]MBJ55466.1 hypothetical protein [Gammaproteobacteria bacterium]HBN15437.1 hypothetical protein [Pseudohongiella sp.]|tara:strand:- start:1774 stop:2883 length:1110 start_codon:yes stop_codon:yes gene_type:complete
MLNLPVRYIKLVLIALILLTALSLLSATTSLLSARSQIREQLLQTIPERLDEALRYSVIDDGIAATINQLMDADLANVPVTSRLGFVQTCSLDLLAIDQSPIQPTNRALTIPWQRSSSPQYAHFDMSCDLQPGRLIAVNSLIALLAALGIALLPEPLDSRQRLRLAQLVVLGMSHREARSLLQRLMSHPNGQQAERETLWLDLAVRISLQHRDDPAEQIRSSQLALAIVRADDAMVFDHASHTVHIHGLAVTMSKTPYFYFAWYARARSSGENQGWILNPATDRPMQDECESLLTMMENHDGHQKAINDLRNNGLRAKTLDQNRNKIKDELTTQLGEALAAHYLFEARRDLRSGRYSYRLACNPEKIKA